MPMPLLLLVARLLVAAPQVQKAVFMLLLLLARLALLPWMGRKLRSLLVSSLPGGPGLARSGVMMGWIGLSEGG